MFSTTFSSFNTPSETVYTIGLLPLGGYVKMKGILDESMDSDFKGADDELESKNALQKIWVMSAGVIMNLILTFFVFVLIGNLQGDTKVENNDTTIDYIVPEQSAELAGIISGDKIISINNKKIKNFSDIKNIVEKNPKNNLLFEVLRNENVFYINVVPDEFYEKKSKKARLHRKRMEQHESN